MSISWGTRSGIEAIVTCAGCESDFPLGVIIHDGNPTEADWTRAKEAATAHGFFAFRGNASPHLCGKCKAKAAEVTR